MKRGLFIFAGILGISALALMLGLWLYLQSLWNNPLALEAGEFRIVPGDNIKRVVRRLGDDHGLEHANLIYLLARFKTGGDIKLGTYTLTPNISARELFEKFAQAKVKLAHFTIPEGFNRWKIRNRLAKDGWLSAQRFDALCDDIDFLAQHNIPGPSCEGYLFPETYTLEKGSQPEALFAAMFQTFHRASESLGIAVVGNGPQKLSLNQLTTLASIVEKETGAPSERPRIACVFYNRLKANPAWRLGTDPTVIYAATLHDPGFDGNLKRWHLYEFKHPYNTYQTRGLPPGPIASAGRAAFEAVLQPSNCGDYFFVSKNDGTHVFCPDIQCHERNVQKWQVEYFRKKKAHE